MTDSIRDRCQGRWPDLLALLGVDARFLSGRHGPCPMCGGRDRYRFDNKEGRGTWICSKCGAGDGFDLLMRMNGWDFKECASRVEEVVGKAQQRVMRAERSSDALRTAMNTLWQAGRRLEGGDLVTRYLASRGISLEEYPASLRLVDRCRYQDNPPGYHPAMLAKMVGPSGEPVIIHKTYLSEPGTKALLDKPRMFMPGKIAKGSTIRLAASAPIMGVAEGIETALSAAALWGVPCWSAVNTTVLMAWEPPVDVTELIIFADNDASFAGQQAAYVLAHRLSVQRSSLTVRVEMPADEDTDWNDVLQSERRDVA